MNASELKYQVESRGTESHYFTRSTMRFFGDTMRNYGVRQTVIIANLTESRRDVWELYRKRPVKENNQSSAYFAVDTFKRVFEKRY